MTSRAMGDKTFPLMWPHRREEIATYERLGCPRSVPWDIVEPHEEQAQKNHGQTLQRLAERGGLSPAELVALLQDRPLKATSGLLPEVTIPLLLRHLALEDGAFI